MPSRCSKNHLDHADPWRVKGGWQIDGSSAGGRHGSRRVLGVVAGPVVPLGGGRRDPWRGSSGTRGDPASDPADESWRASSPSPLAPIARHRLDSDLVQVRWVSPRSVDTRGLARSLFEAASLCARLQRHLSRRSTSTSRRAPREPRSWHHDCEAVVNAWSKPQLDPGDTRRSSTEHAAQTLNLGLPGREPLHAQAPKRSGIRRPPCPTKQRGSA